MESFGIHRRRSLPAGFCAGVADGKSVAPRCEVDLADRGVLFGKQRRHAGITGVHQPLEQLPLLEVEVPPHLAFDVLQEAAREIRQRGIAPRAAGGQARGTPADGLSDTPSAWNGAPRSGKDAARGIDGPQKCLVPSQARGRALG
jgi:hypothetical protein